VNIKPSPNSVAVEASVVESEERLRLATEAADMFAWEIDLLANTLKWAPNSARVIGCRPDELPLDPAKGSFFAMAEDRARILGEFAMAIERGDESYSLEFRGDGGDKDRAFWQVHGKFIRNDQGTVMRAIGATQNITKQKNAEDALRLVAERLTTAEEAAGALIYDWDVASNKIWRSGGLTRILGWLPEEIGEGLEGWVKLRHPDDEKRMAPLAYADYVQANDHYVLEYRMRHKTGHYVWVLDSGRVFRDGSGNVIRIAGATVDVSARKKVEASINRQANLIDLSFEPIFVWHPENGIVDWNRGAEQLYGYSRAEAMGQSSHGLLHTISPLPQEELLEILRVGKSWTGELEHRAKDGRQVFVESRHQVIDSDGEMLILETNHDISQRKRADTYTARMAAVAVASHDALFGITLEGIVETWNPAAERMFGYVANEAIGQHISILAEPSRHEEQRDLIRRAHGNETVGPYDARRLRKDGSFVDVSVALAPVKAADGSLMSISVAIHDISDRKEWEARQRLMTRELAHRNKNSFAVLQGILRSTLRTSRNPHEFAEAFSGRLHSLAAAQDILTANDWKGAELGALARHQLAAYVQNEDHRVDISGPEVNLPAEYAAPFGLIFNELATNALKHGALSVPTGNIQIIWRTERNLDSSIRIFLTWRERGGPEVTTQGPRGFGSTLIEKSLAGAKVENAFDPEGLTCKIELTLNTLKKLKSRRRSKVLTENITAL
jgi:PAS domain S-box-containing protein